MTGTSTRIACEIDLDADGKQCGFLRLPHSVHRSAYGWLPFPVVCIKNGAGPTAYLQAGIHGDGRQGETVSVHGSTTRGTAAGARQGAPMTRDGRGQSGARAVWG